MKGKSILDIGCAEGLIAIYLATHGAASVHGVEIVSGHIAVAEALAHEVPHCTFEIGDANWYVPKRQYDITIMLALLQKLRNPTLAAMRYADMTKDLCVIRLPPKHAPLVIDPRSAMEVHDIEAALDRRGFTLEQITRGAYDEWCGYFRRT